MSEHRFTDEQIMATLREVVAENPDYVYESPAEAPEHLSGGYRLSECFYVHNDGPGCLVGHVMHRLGMPLDELKQREFSAAEEFGFHDPVISVRAANALEDAQSTQDNGDTWADALDAAETAYERD